MKKIAVTVVVLLACFTTTPTMSALYLAPLTPLLSHLADENSPIS